MRKALQELDIHNYFYYPRGKFNAITDVTGVKVGHCTIIQGENVRTGVTVIIPPGISQQSLIAGGFAFNANGEVTGLQYIFEEGKLISPIFLTNTLSVGDVFSAVVDYYQGNIALPVIGECWDGYLNDIAGRHVKKDHVVKAIETAKSGTVEQGNVGAGTGMACFGFKAGIGTSSRIVRLSGKDYHIGVLVNNNMGGEDGSRGYLRINGIDVSRFFKNIQGMEKSKLESHQNSSILTIATDIPLDHRQLNRLAEKSIFGVGRLGLISYTGSGDFVISFSTANRIPKHGTKILWQIETIEETLLNDVLEATIEAVEEAYLNSLLLAEDMKGKNGHEIKAIPAEKIFHSQQQ